MCFYYICCNICNKCAFIYIHLVLTEYLVLTENMHTGNNFPFKI